MPIEDLQSEKNIHVEYFDEIPKNAYVLRIFKLTWEHSGVRKEKKIYQFHIEGWEHFKTDSGKKKN